MDAAAEIVKLHGIRGFNASASLKLFWRLDFARATRLHPRLQRLGLIEASQSGNPSSVDGLHPRLQRLGLIEASWTTAAIAMWTASHPRLQRLGLIEAHRSGGAAMSLSRRIRGFNASASLKRGSRRVEPCSSTCIRGFNASASLKHRNQPQRARGDRRIRGFNASASLKRSDRADDGGPARGIRGFNASASLKRDVHQREHLVRRDASEASTPRPH